MHYMNIAFMKIKKIKKLDPQIKLTGSNVYKPVKVLLIRLTASASLINLSTIPGIANICCTFFVPINCSATVGHLTATDFSIRRRPFQALK